MDSISAVTLTDRELAAHLDEATRKLQGFPFRVPAEAAARPEGSATLEGRRVSYRPLQGRDAGGTRELELSLAGRVHEIAPGDALPSDVEHRVLRILRRAIQVHARIYRDYEQASGLDRLKQANRAGRLAGRDEPELKEKLESASAAALFALAAYLLARLQDVEPEASEGLGVEPEPPGDLPLGGRTRALHAALHHLWRAVDAHARDDASLVAAVREAARQLAGRIDGLRHSLQYLDFYTRYHYRIEPEGVLLAGFQLPEEAPRSEIHVPRKRPEEVVGNHVAKLEACRIAQRLACYDPERQSNPFVDLGGFVFTFIGDGKPGTGKTTLIQMIVTLLRDYTEVAGLPLRYANFSVDEISDYQGRSGQNAKRFCQNLLDPSVVGFGTVDDVDQVCGNRNDRNASAGQLEVTGVFMQQFGGAGTVVRGNASFGFFSNYPEKVDDALRQRTQARFLVDGPRTREDFTDLLHILLHRSWELPMGEGYEPLVTQEVRRVIQQKYAEHDVPLEPETRAVFDAICARHGAGSRLATWRAFGEYLHALQERDPRFTGRAVKNIADAVHARMMDFDLPAEWLEKREAFFGQPYEKRVAMIAELRGEVTPAMVIQEINRYADSEARYGEAADRRALDERTRQIVLDARARKAASETEI